MSVDSFDLAAEYAKYGKSMVQALLPEGQYELRVKKATPGQTQKGKISIKMVHEVISGPSAGETVPDMQTWSPENDTSVRIWNQNLTILGASEAWITQNKANLRQVCDRITGTTFRGNIKHGEFNGAPQARLSYSSTIAGPPPSGTGTQGAVTLGMAPAQAQPEQVAHQQVVASEGINSTAPQAGWPSV